MLYEKHRKDDHQRYFELCRRLPPKDFTVLIFLQLLYFYDAEVLAVNCSIELDSLASSFWKLGLSTD